MVRIIAPPIESGHDTEMQLRADVDPEMGKDAVRAQTSTGYRDRVLLPLQYNSWGCGGLFSKWGFDDSYPVLLRRNLPLEDWKYALARIHTGYIGSIWPKVIFVGEITCPNVGDGMREPVSWLCANLYLSDNCSRNFRMHSLLVLHTSHTHLSTRDSSLCTQMVWAPFWSFLIIGAILEGACHMSDVGDVPFGTIIGSLTAAGLIVSLVLSKVYETWVTYSLSFPRTYSLYQTTIRAYRDAYIYMHTGMHTSIHTAMIHTCPRERTYVKA